MSAEIRLNPTTVPFREGLEAFARVVTTLAQMSMLRESRLWLLPSATRSGSSSVPEPKAVRCITDVTCFSRLTWHATKSRLGYGRCTHFSKSRVSASQSRSDIDILQSIESNSVSNEDGSDSEEDEGDAWIVEEVTTPYNQITVIEMDADAEHELAGAWVLKLDDRDLAHSVYWNDGRRLTGSYYDEVALLPPLLPEGPIGIYGLGAGTEARILLQLWPDLHLEGWEIDSEVVRMGRLYFGLSQLELQEGDGGKAAAGRKKGTGKQPSVVQSSGDEKCGGHLVVHIGDVFKKSARVAGGFAGLFVDLYSKGRICEALTQEATWGRFRKRLRQGGRILVNCGGPPIDGDSREWKEQMIATATAMAGAYDGDICIKEVGDESRNVLLLSGSLPDPFWWSAQLPDAIKGGVSGWRPW